MCGDEDAEALSAVQSGEIDIALARLDDRVAALESPIVHDHWCWLPRIIG